MPDVFVWPGGVARAIGCVIAGAASCPDEGRLLDAISKIPKYDDPEIDAIYVNVWDDGDWIVFTWEPEHA